MQETTKGGAMPSKAIPQLPYTIKEVAAMYGRSTEYIRQEIVKGRLKAARKRGEKKTLYIKPEWVKEWTENYLEET